MEPERPNFCRVQRSGDPIGNIRVDPDASKDLPTLVDIER
jgi:hypothetical protein